MTIKEIFKSDDASKLPRLRAVGFMVSSVRVRKFINARSQIEVISQSGEVLLCDEQEARRVAQALRTNETDKWAGKMLYVSRGKERIATNRRMTWLMASLNVGRLFRSSSQPQPPTEKVDPRKPFSIFPRR